MLISLHQRSDVMEAINELLLEVAEKLIAVEDKYNYKAYYDYLLSLEG